jgi:hypothetical protein
MDGSKVPVSQRPDLLTSETRSTPIIYGGGMTFPVEAGGGVALLRPTSMAAGACSLESPIQNILNIFYIL